MDHKSAGVSFRELYSSPKLVKLKKQIYETKDSF
jgi:hypothetical protein